MAIGQKMGSLKTLKQSLAKGGNNAWIKYIPKNGSMNVRFIQEPEEWINYVEHYDTVLRKSFPCNGEQGCPGCQGDARKSSRYLANAVDVDNDRVIPLQMPKDLANRLVVRYERNGTLTDRDFELSRSGDGLDTVYDLDAGAADRKKIDKYSPLDLIKVLTDAFNEVFGSDTDDDDSAPVVPKSKPKPIQRSKAAKMLDKHEPDVDDEKDEDEVEVEVPIEKPALKAAKAKADKKAGKKAAPPEPEFTAEDEEDDDEGYDEETLRALPLGALRAVAREFSVDPKGMDTDEIVDAILAAGEPVEDDKPPY
jgi:hypothetical protein